ncbi:hypothetical protein ML462_03975 [Gramella lutea]|uniref:Lipoprotein n=1 Tax=Christiangramia lutea TaxID=1607951 RepID=A0A9X1V113_9FLAO|nr:hypothetical protein [Christiangramia lutea]MCH4822322.1 hypothetical protein [Christiangramia lutea]
MKSSSKHFRFLSSILSLVFLLQSCSIYHNDSISLQQAEELNKDVRITTESGDKFKFKSIEEEDGDYFGLTRLKSKTSKELQKMGLIGRETGKLYAFGLEPLNIEKIQEKNKTVSTIGTVGLVITGIFVVIIIIAAITFNDGIFSPW